MKSNIKQTLKRVGENIDKLQPSTMDDLINTVHSTEGAGNYGTSFSIVKYKGRLQGVRVYVTGRKRTHILPAYGKAYPVLKGVDKYEAAGWKIENDDAIF